MKPSRLLSPLLKSSSRRNQRRFKRSRHNGLEQLESRQMLTAFAWDGDHLKIEGTDGDDFIAVQNDALGTKVFTEDSVFTEFDGRDFSTAASIEVDGMAGNDVLMSYQNDAPVTLNGANGNDILFSDSSADPLDGGDGLNWLSSPDITPDENNAFGIPDLKLGSDALTISPVLEDGGRVGLQIDVDGETELGNLPVQVTGQAVVSGEGTRVEVTGTVDEWNDAFGFDGLDLQDTQVTVTADSGVESTDYRIDLATSLELGESLIQVTGSVDVQETTTALAFAGSLQNWDDAFGVPELDLQDATFSAAGLIENGSASEVEFSMSADMLIEKVAVDVSGSVVLGKDRTDVQLQGSVDNWDDAFGIEALDLVYADLDILAMTDASGQTELNLDIEAQLEYENFPIDLEGHVAITPSMIDAAFSGTLDGWDDAFGIPGLDFQETTLTVAGQKTAEETTMSLGVETGVEILGTALPFSGIVTFDGEDVTSEFTSSLPGEWSSAFGLPGLNLRDVGFTISDQSDAGDSGESDSSSGYSIQLDTDLQLFGSYIDVIGDLKFSPTGFDLSFTPPQTQNFTDLLGIPGFTLNDADLTVTATDGGLSIGLGSIMDMGSVDIGFIGDIRISPDGIQANLAGVVPEWSNAFDVPGLNLQDVALALQAESGPGGASFEIGLGAGILIGSTRLDVAGMIGVGPTGWRPAFRGSVDSLTSDDLVDFANTLNKAGDPNAKEIPDGALGDLEVRDAYLNFAPYGGNEALGITDGFGIGGEFLNDSESLGSGEIVIDVAQGVFELDLAISSLALGPIGIRDVVIDIRMAPTDSHFHVAGTASLMGASVTLNGQISRDNFSLSGQTTLDVAGLSSSVEFMVDTHGVRFTATSNGAFINAAKDAAIGGLQTAAHLAQDAIDSAQDAVDKARRGVDSLEADLAEARAEAQEEVDRVKANIDKAKSVVDAARRSRDSWKSRKSSHYRSWRSAVSKTRSAKWYNKPYYKSIEVSRYARYKATSARYSIQVGVYNTANATYNAVRSAAGWVLDSAGVEANPNVLRIKALLAAANLGLDTAEMVLDGAEELSSGALKALAYADSLKVNRITISGSALAGSGASFNVKVDYELDGRSHLLELDASTEDIGKQLAQQMIAMVV